MPFGSDLSSRDAFSQLQDRLYGSLGGYVHMSPELETGGRQISVYHPGKRDIVSFQSQWDPLTGRFHVSGMPINPSFHPKFRSEGGFGAMEQFVSNVAAGFDPRQIAGMETELDPYVYHRRQIGRQGPFTGGQALAPWSLARQTEQFMGSHPDASYPFSDVSHALAIPGQVGMTDAIYSTSGIMRRPFEFQYGPLARSAQSLRVIPGYGVEGDSITVPYKDQKDRERMATIGPGVVPTIHGGAQTHPFLRGELAGYEEAQALTMRTEFVPGLLMPGAGQSYYTTQQFQGVQLGTFKDFTQSINYPEMRRYMERTGRSAGTAMSQYGTGGTGLRGSSFGTFLGQDIEPGVRGAQGYIPEITALRLPYGEGLYSLLEQVAPKALGQLLPIEREMSGGRTQEYEADFLRHRPTTPAQIGVYEEMLGQFGLLAPDWKLSIGGGMEIEPYAGGANARPSLYYGGEVLSSAQSGMGLQIPGIKTAAVGMQSLTGMGALSTTQLLLAGESVKGMPFLTSGIAQTLPRTLLDPYLGPRADEMFDAQGNLIYGGEYAGSINRASMDILRDLRAGGPQSEEFGRYGLSYREAWFTPDVQRRDAMAAMQEAGTLGERYTGIGREQVGMWRDDPRDRTRIQQYLGSMSMIQPVIPFEQFSGGGAGQSLTELYRARQWAPGQYQTLLDSGQESRAHYSAAIMASVNAVPTGTTPLDVSQGMALPTMRARELAAAANQDPTMSAAMLSGKESIPLRYTIEAMAETPALSGKFLATGGGIIPPAESLLTTVGWTPSGEPVAGGVGAGLRKVIGAMESGEGIAQAGFAFQQALHTKVGKSPAMWREALGSESPDSSYGRAVHLGAGPADPGQFGIVLPDSFRGIGLEKDDLARLIRAPFETTTGTVHALGSVMFAGEYADWQKKQGLDAIDPRHFQIGQVGYFGAGFALADLLKVDIDKDLLGMIIERGALSANPEYKHAFSAAVAESKAMYPYGDPRHKSVDAASLAGVDITQFFEDKPTTVMTAGQSREQRGVDAIMKQRVGLAHNLMQFLDYAVDQHGGVDPETKKMMMDAIGTIVKNQYIDQSKALRGDTAEATSDIGEGFFTPMNVRAFMGREGKYGTMTAPTFGHGMVMGDIRGKSQTRITPTSMMRGFVKGTFELMGDATPGYATAFLAGAFGGQYDQETDEISGIPTYMSNYIKAIGEGRHADAEQALAGTTGVSEWFYQTPIGAITQGRMVSGAFGAATVTERREAEGEAVTPWAKNRATATLEQLRDRPDLVKSMNKFLDMVAVMQSSSRRGALRAPGAMGGFTKIDSIEELLERIQTLAQSGSDMYGEVLSMLPLGDTTIIAQHFATTPAASVGAAVAARGGASPEETERWYRYTPYDSSSGGFASTSAPQTLGRVGDARSAGRTGTIDWTDLTSTQSEAARLAAPGENVRRGRTGGVDDREGFFPPDTLRGMKWSPESELPGGAMPGSIKSAAGIPEQARGIPGEPGLNKLSQTELQDRQRETEREIQAMRDRGETPVFDKWGRLVRDSSLGGTGKGGGGTMPYVAAGETIGQGQGGGFQYPRPYTGINEWGIIGKTVASFASGGTSYLPQDDVQRMIGDYMDVRGGEVLDPHFLMQMAQERRHGAPPSAAVGKKAFRVSESLRKNVGADADDLIHNLRAIGMSSLDESVRGSAMSAALQGGMTNIGQSNFGMQRANVPMSEIRSIDQAVIAEGRLGVTPREGLVSDKLKVMGAIDALGGRAGTEGEAMRLEDIVADTQWTTGGLSGKGRMAMAAKRLEMRTGTSAGPDSGSGNFKEAIESIQRFGTELDVSSEKLKLMNKNYEETLKLEKLTSVEGQSKWAEDRGKLGVPAWSQGGYRYEVGQQQEAARIAEGRLGQFQAIQALPDAGLIDQVQADIGKRFAPGKKAMTFYDLMYMKRVGQIFTGGMQAAGEETAAMDTAMGQQLYGIGAIGMPAQSPAEQARVTRANVQAAQGRAYNQVWGAAMETSALGGIMPQAQAIGGPMAANALLASYFLPGVPAAPAIASAVTGIAGVISMGMGAKTEGGMMDLGAKLASDRSGRRDMGLGDYFALGAGVIASSGKEGGVQAFDAQVEHESRVQDVIATRGYSKSALDSVSPAQALTAISSRAQNIKFRGISRGMKIADDVANRVAVQMTQLAPGGLTEAQENKWVDAAMMGLDPGGMASQMYQATTGMMVTGSTDAEALAMQLTDPKLADQAMRFMGEGGASIQNQLLRMGGTGIDWENYNLSGYEADRWMTVSSALEGLAAQGIIDPGEMEGLTTERFMEQDFRAHTVTERRVAKVYTPEQGVRAGGAAGFISQMYAAGRGELAEAMAAGYGGIGDAPTDTGFQSDVFAYQTGGGAGRSQVALDKATPWLATHDPATGYKNFQMSATGLGMTPGSFRDLFATKGMDNQVTAAFLGDTQVSAITGEAIGGLTGMAYQAQQASFDRARAGLGIQGAQLALRRQYTTGEGMPGGRGFWQIQDDMTSLSREQQTYGWQTAGRRMEMQKTQFTETFGANVEQFGARTSWARDDQAFKAARMGRAQQWAKEDWAVSDQVRNMQWGWQNEDFEENVRFASGRDRQLMVREQERATTMHNVEGDQIDTQRERQEELWNLEEEQFEIGKARFEESVTWQEDKFEREKSYFEQGMELSEEQHEKEMEFMKRRWALEDEMRNMQREFQKKQMDLAEAGLGLQYQALKQQEDQQAIQNVINELTITALAAGEGGKRVWAELMAIINGWTPPVGGSGWIPPNIDDMDPVEQDMWNKNLTPQTGFSGLINSPTSFLVAEGSGGIGGAAEYVSVTRMGAGGIPEAMGQRDGGTVNVTVILDGEEIASHVMVERGNNLRVEAFR